MKKLGQLFQEVVMANARTQDVQRHVLLASRDYKDALAMEDDAKRRYEEERERVMLRAVRMTKTMAKKKGDGDDSKLSAKTERGCGGEAVSVRLRPAGGKGKGRRTGLRPM